ncbi:MAG: YfjI family protein [Pseudomonadota bacterium]
MDYIGPLREPVEAIAELTSAPIEIAFQSILATASLATQHICNVQTFAGPAPLSLFLLTVATSGERKSSCDKLATAAIHDWEEENWEHYLQKRREFEIAHTAYEARVREAVKARTDGDAVIDVPTPLPPVPPVVPRKILSDITYEGLLRHFDNGEPSIGIFADEGGQFFGGHGMGRDNQLKTAAGLSKVWDAAPLNRTRAGSPQSTYRHRRGALHLMIQPGIAETVLSNDLLKDQGWLSRTLIAWPNSRIGLRLIDASGREGDAKRRALDVLGTFNARISALLKYAPETPPHALEASPTLLDLSPDAKAMLVDFANQIEVNQYSDGSLAHIKGFASKAAEQAAWIAGVLTVLQNYTVTDVPVGTMECAIRITEWYITEAQRLMDAGAVDPGIQQAQRLLEFLQRKYADRPFDKRTIIRFGPSSVRDAATADKALRTLEAYGHVRQGTGPRIIHGSNSATNWELVKHA